MKQKLILIWFLFVTCVQAQTNPAITKWMQNSTTFGRYYFGSNPTPITMTVLANCQQVRYNTTDVYVNTTGIPAYVTGVFTGDGNQNLAGDQNAVYRIPLNPVANTGTLTATSGGNNGVFINGVSIFDYRDGVAWSATTNALCGGPGRPACTGGFNGQSWHRDAIPAEKLGFDCAKGHPAGTNYHHHQNPSAFKHDSNLSNTYSSICTMYDSEGLYTIVPTQHSPLLGFAYDGFPIYGAYAYANTNGTGAITRMKSGYSLRNITVRTHLADGTDVPDGPAISTTYPLGYFKEDYEFIANASPDYLDVHNGRFCVTPEYPAGIYCYFTTVNADQSSAYPYIIGPTFFGVKTSQMFTETDTLPSGLTTYTPSLSNQDFSLDKASISVFPNPVSEYITVQTDFVEKDLKVELFNELGQLVRETNILQGTTFCIIETNDLYGGIYFVKVISGSSSKSYKVIINK